MSKRHAVRGEVRWGTSPGAQVRHRVSILQQIAQTRPTVQGKTLIERSMKQLTVFIVEKKVFTVRKKNCIPPYCIDGEDL